MAMDKLTEIEVFLRIADEGSLAGAARKLRRTPSSVSKILRQLEDRLGVPLITRTTRSMALTDAGREYNERWRDILAEIEEAERLTAHVHSEVGGHLCVAGVMVLSQPLVIAAIGRFLAAHPGVTLELRRLDTMPGIDASGADVGLRVGQLSAKGLVCEPIAGSYRIICASPGYIERHGRPASFDDLRSHRCLTLSANPLVNSWEMERDGEALRIQPEGAFSASHADLLRLAAIEGAGIAQFADVLVGPDLRDGRLVALFPEQLERPNNHLCAVYPRRDRTPRKVTAFIDFLCAEFAPVPPWQHGIGISAPPPAVERISAWRRKRRRWQA